jgi:hypothetical protein
MVKKVVRRLHYSDEYCYGFRVGLVPGAEVADIDWLSATLRVERAIVRQRVGDVKTVYSGRLMSIDSGMPTPRPS